MKHSVERMTNSNPAIEEFERLTLEIVCRRTLNSPITTETRVASAAAENPALLRYNTKEKRDMVMVL